MSDSSAIEWTDATWNPVTGCTKVSQGCKNCYAERDWVRLSANPKSVYFRRAFTDVRCHPDRLKHPLRWSRPRRIFVNSMSDLFHQDVPDEFIREVLTTAANALQHTFQILTKRPVRMKKIMDDLLWVTGTPPAIAQYQSGRHHLHIHRSIWREAFEKAVAAGEIRVEEDKSGRSQIMPAGAPENIWLGVSVEDQATADERIPLLLQTPAAVRWISAEPLLGPISFEGCWIEHENPAIHENWLERLNWVVAGGESGPNARASHPDWFRSLRDQCAGSGVPFFFKQWGEWISGEKRDGTFFWQDGKKQIVRFGRQGDEQGFWDDLKPCARIGKKAAGRMLDGRTHDEYPT